MSYPYLGDAVRDLVGIDLPLPLPTFGLCVALAVLMASALFQRELRRMGRAAAFVMPLAQIDAFTSHFTVVVTLAGVVGARIFHILEHLPEFMAHPAPMIFSRSGLSIMGGLIFGALAGVALVRRARLPLRTVMDAVAPALMLGYGLGRIGCQISGDGDWGLAADMALKPAWLPSWLWAQTYDHNIVGEMIAPPGVYPTPLYETAMALSLSALLWAWRRHPYRRGWLFAVYLLLAGAERLLIEQIRVNPVFELLALRATQAEWIASGFMVLGLAGMLGLQRRKETQPAAMDPSWE